LPYKVWKVDPSTAPVVRVDGAFYCTSVEAAVGGAVVIHSTIPAG